MSSVGDVDCIVWNACVARVSRRSAAAIIGSVSASSIPMDGGVDFARHCNFWVHGIHGLLWLLDARDVLGVSFLLRGTLYDWGYGVLVYLRTMQRECSSISSSPVQTYYNQRICRT